MEALGEIKQKKRCLEHCWHSTKGKFDQTQVRATVKATVKAYFSNLIVSSNFYPTALCLHVVWRTSYRDMQRNVSVG